MAMYLAMAVYALSLSVTPGPVNMISLSSGLNNGFKKTLFFVIGAGSGFTLLLITTGYGLGSLIESYPQALKILTYIGAGFIIYMGYKISRSSTELKTKETNIPKFYQGFLLQWLNPKAWIACLSGVAMFSKSYPGELNSFYAIYYVVCCLSVGCWALLGEKIKVLLNTEKRMKIFNSLMGGSLVLISVYLLASS